MGKKLRSMAGERLSEAIGDNPLGGVLGGAAEALLGGDGGSPEAPPAVTPPETGEKEEDEKKGLGEQIKEKAVEGLLDRLL